MGALLLALSLSWTGVTFAQSSPVGVINSFSGSVSILHQDGSSINAKIGAKLSVADIVKTGDDGLAKIIMQDQNIFMLNEDSELILKEYPLKGTSKGSTTLETKGDLHLKINQRYNDEDSSFRLITSSAVAGVKGTEFAVADREGQTQITTLEGKVEVGEKMQGRKIQNPVSLEKGLQISANRNGVDRQSIKHLSASELAGVKAHSLRTKSNVKSHSNKKPGPGMNNNNEESKKPQKRSRH